MQKPWGHETIWAHTDRYVGKILHIKAGHALSVQYHEHKDETLYLAEGEVELVVEEDGALTSLVLRGGAARAVEEIAQTRRYTRDVGRHVPLHLDAHDR